MGQIEADTEFSEGPTLATVRAVLVLTMIVPSIDHYYRWARSQVDCQGGGITEANSTDEISVHECSTPIISYQPILTINI
jgi:hypothetical protein